MILEKITSKYINYITVRNYDKSKKYIGQDCIVKYLLNRKNCIKMMEKQYIEILLR